MLFIFSAFMIKSRFMKHKSDVDLIKRKLVGEERRGFFRHKGIREERMSDQNDNATLQVRNKLRIPTFYTSTSPCVFFIEYQRGKAQNCQLKAAS